MKKIVILASPHPFGAIQSPAEMIANGLKENKCEAHVFLINKESGAKEFIEYLKANDVEAVVALNPAVLRLRYRLRRILSYVKTKLCVFMLDDPSYHLKAIEFVIQSFKSTSLLWMLPELNQKKSLDNYLSQHHIKGVSTVFFPWAGPSPRDFVGQREPLYDCAIFCTLDQQIVQGVGWTDFVNEIKEKFDNENAELILQQMLIQEYDVPVSELLFKLTGIQLSLNNLVSVDLWRRLDSLLKEGRRLQLAKQLIHIAEIYQIRMIVCGTGWDKLGKLPPSISFAGAVHYDQQFELFRNSKILVNLDPNWVYGAHDRVFNAISVGGVCSHQCE